MQNKDEQLRAVVAVWERVNNVSRDSDFPDINIPELISSIFNPGRFFYLLINFFDLRMEYVHTTIEEMLGIQPHTFDFSKLFEILHPQDAQEIKLKEEAAALFFYNRIPIEKIPFYKSTYSVRLADAAGKYRNFLVSNIALTVTDGRIHHVLSVFTDITFLNLLPDSRISFVGIKGEPSFYSLSTDPKTILQPQQDLKLSRRECEVVRLLAQGLSSKEAAAQLNIASSTVDTHRRRLLKKTGTRNTMELAILCLRNGLL